MIIWYKHFHTAAPVLTGSSSSLSITDKDEYNIKLSCTSSGSPPDTFKWMKDGVPITQSTDTTVVTHTSTSAVFSSNYTVENFNFSDDGIYTCTVTNPIGSDSATVTLNLCKLLYEIWFTRQML